MLRVHACVSLTSLPSLPFPPLPQDCPTDREIKIPLIGDMVDVLQAEAAQHLRVQGEQVRVPIAVCIVFLALLSLRCRVWVRSSTRRLTARWCGSWRHVASHNAAAVVVVAMVVAMVVAAAVVVEPERGVTRPGLGLAQGPARDACHPPPHAATSSPPTLAPRRSGPQGHAVCATRRSVVRRGDPHPPTPRWAGRGLGLGRDLRPALAAGWRLEAVAVAVVVAVAVAVATTAMRVLCAVGQGGLRHKAGRVRSTRGERWPLLRVGAMVAGTSPAAVPVPVPVPVPTPLRTVVRWPTQERAPRQAAEETVAMPVAVATAVPLLPWRLAKTLGRGQVYQQARGPQPQERRKGKRRQITKGLRRRKRK